MLRNLVLVLFALVFSTPAFALTTLDDHCVTASNDVFMFWDGSTSQEFRLWVSTTPEDEYVLDGETYCIGYENGEDCGFVLNHTFFGTNFEVSLRECAPAPTGCGAWGTYQGPVFLLDAPRGADLNASGGISAADYNLLNQAYNCSGGSISDADNSFHLDTPPAP